MNPGPAAWAVPRRTSVPYYRLYFLDRRGRFGRVEGFAAPDDDAAVSLAEGQDDCIQKQKRAMKKALAYTKKYDPPAWKIHLCNRRAVQRRSGRVDWISYNNCIRSPAVQPSSASRSSR